MFILYHRSADIIVALLAKTDAGRSRHSGLLRFRRDTDGMMIRTARRELERVMELLLGLPVQSQSHLTATTRREIAMAEAEAAQLAQEYLSLGGRRKTAADDNAMSTRLWQDEPAEAKAYWDSNIAPLPDARRKEVESNLPSISGDSR